MQNSSAHVVYINLRARKYTLEVIDKLIPSAHPGTKKIKVMVIKIRFQSKLPDFLKLCE